MATLFPGSRGDIRRLKADELAKISDVNLSKLKYGGKSLAMLGLARSEVTAEDFAAIRRRAVGLKQSGNKAGDFTRKDLRKLLAFVGDTVDARADKRQKKKLDDLQDEVLVPPVFRKEQRNPLLGGGMSGQLAQYARLSIGSARTSRPAADASFGRNLARISVG